MCVFRVHISIIRITCQKSAIFRFWQTENVTWLLNNGNVPFSGTKKKKEESINNKHYYWDFIIYWHYWWDFKSLLYFISADPFIEHGFETAPEGTQLVIVEVGDRSL